MKRDEIVKSTAEKILSELNENIIQDGGVTQFGVEEIVRMVLDQVEKELQSYKTIVIPETAIKNLVPLPPGRVERINVPEEPKEHIVGLPGLQFDRALDMRANNEERKFGEEMSEEDMAKHFNENPFKGNLPVKRLNDMSMDEIKDWEKAQDNSTDIYKIAARVKNLARGGNASLTDQGEMLCNTYVHVMKSFYDFASTIVDNLTREELIELIRSHENMPGNLIAAAGVGVKKK